MTAKVKNSSGFVHLEMYAENNGKINKLSFIEESPSWKLIEIKRIKVKNGKVDIGFVAEGLANAFCYVDDVSLVKTK
jgi:hypothetical protein